MKNQKRNKPPVISNFDLPAGRILAGKYEILSRLGAGWEGEVFLVREHPSGIERAVKLFYPQRNPRDKIANFYARKLHKLRHCPIVIQYHFSGIIHYRKIPITFLVSDFIEGELLCDFLDRQPGKRLTPFQALHLLHALAIGIESIHAMKEYHGDLHTGNIIIQRFGLGFDLKLLDFFHWGAPSQENIYFDVINMVKLLHEAIGGAKHYSKQPKVIKDICRGLKRSLILKNFRTAGQLREYLEMLSWD
ncbi:MAG: protein kinase [Gammaproteobacteria bacterium]|nr:protein kinase [Gammaproteobacteria bacterium]